MNTRVVSGLTAKSKILTPEFRVSYANIWLPQEQKNGAKVYGLTAIFERNADLSEMRELARLAKEAKFPNFTGKLRSPFRLGVQVDDEHPNGFDLGKNPEYEGKIIIPFKSYNRPVGCIKPDKTEFEEHEQSQFYSGCYADAFITAFAYDNESKGVSFGLSSVRKRRDGTPLVSMNDAKSDYKALPGIVQENESEFDEDDDDLGI